MDKWNDKLQQARINKGISQQEVSNALGITRGCYAHYEQGVREPSIDLLKRICDYFDISADYLIGRTDY